MKKLLKFRLHGNGHGPVKEVWLDPEQISSLSEIDPHYYLNNTVNVSSSGAVGATCTLPTQYPACTQIQIGYQTYIVEHHITEILAILEGRDPRPAQILFGQK